MRGVVGAGSEGGDLGWWLGWLARWKKGAHLEFSIFPEKNECIPSRKIDRHQAAIEKFSFLVEWALPHLKLRTEMVAAFHLSIAQTASTAHFSPSSFPERSTSVTTVLIMLDRTRVVIEPRAPRTSAPLACEPPSQ
jgi:hypothetical protein